MKTIILHFITNVKVLIKWLNLPLPISLSFWDKWWFNMVSEPVPFNCWTFSRWALPPLCLRVWPIMPHVRGRLYKSWCSLLSQYVFWEWIGPMNFNMVSEPKVMSSNIDSVIYLPFQLNIQRVGHHLSKGSLNPHVRMSVKVLIKWLNLHLLISLSFWDKWWFNINH
jgi:hypothetical protein